MLACFDVVFLVNHVTIHDQTLVHLHSFVMF